MTSAASPDTAPIAAVPTAADPGFGLYVHWPFCRAKCPYCDFNSHVRDRIDQARWRSALLAELAHFAGQVPGRRLTSIFFGGGTPSLMDPATVAAVVAAARGQFTFAPDIEISLEANPTSSEAERFAAFAAAGVNRLSVGVQALDDRALAFLGRQHSTTEARAAVDLARRAVARVSFDLIYARPGQSIADWRRELEAVLDEGPEHISLYQLTIEPGTAFEGAVRRGALLPMADDEAAGLFAATRSALVAAGLPAYEVSNHAQPGAACRHNLPYWRYGDYLGIGPGAHGRLTLAGRKIATRQHRAPEAWLAQVEEAGHATRGWTALSPRERLAELVMMGLRLAEGIPRAAFRRELGEGPDSLLDARRLKRLSEAGYLCLDDGGLVATSEGMLRLDAVLSHLLP